MSDDARRDGRHGRMGDDPTTTPTTRDDPHAAADRLRGEWEYDYLVQLAARAEMRREDSPFYTDAALVAWVDREARAAERAETGWDAARVAYVAERLRARAASARLGVAVADGGPPLRDAAVVGTVPQVMGAASAARCAPALALAAAAGSGRELWDEPCDQWVTLPADAGAGEFVAVKVSGDSMTPLFLPGDMILVRIGQRVERDTVVVARHPDDGYVVKRVGRVGRTSLVLTSLNPAFAPVTVPRAGNAVVGTVVMCWRGGSAAANRVSSSGT